MEKKDAIIVLWQNSDEKIADIYDDNAEVASALNLLVDGFEYPDHSHKKVKAVLLAYFLKNQKEFDLEKRFAIMLWQVISKTRALTSCPTFTTMQIAIGEFSQTTTKLQTLWLSLQQRAGS